MTLSDKIVIALALLFVAGLVIGGWGLLLCVPLVLLIAAAAFAIWFANEALKGLKLW